MVSRTHGGGTQEERRNHGAHRCGYRGAGCSSTRGQLQPHCDRATPVSPAPLPAEPKVITDLVFRKKHLMPIYVGNGVAIPHGRISGISRPVLAFARCDLGVPMNDSSERAELVFLLITPSGKARMQSRLLANINALFKSEYVSERLRKSQSPDAVIEALRQAMQTASSSRV